MNIQSFFTTRAIVLTAITLLLLATNGSVYADADITFRGSLLEAPPCVVNGGDNVEVDFGDEMMTTRIDGTQYRQKIDFTLDCTDAIASEQKLRIRGASISTVEGEVLSTPLTGLGLALYHGETRYTPGEWIAFTDPDVPELYAVPVRLDSTAPEGGTFSVLASLVVDYQ
ncbi:fimbrial protein [Enterobacteriaceae bacterium 4M9]|nr:fimbrial protein [Enterobacteriaceae bacterium 4M9]